MPSSSPLGPCRSWPAGSPATSLVRTGWNCAITTRRATPDLLEVTAGLNEGERVVLRPVDVDGIPVESRIGDPGSDARNGANRIANSDGIARAIESSGFVISVAYLRVAQKFEANQSVLLVSPFTLR